VSTISTLLHEQINPKNWQLLSLGDFSGFSNFLGLFQVITGKPRSVVLHVACCHFIHFSLHQISHTRWLLPRNGDGFFAPRLTWFFIIDFPCEEYGFHYKCGTGFEFYELGSCLGQCLTVEECHLEGWKNGEWAEISTPLFSDEFLLGKCYTWSLLQFLCFEYRVPIGILQDHLLPTPALSKISLDPVKMINFHWPKLPWPSGPVIVTWMRNDLAPQTLHATKWLITSSAASKVMKAGGWWGCDHWLTWEMIGQIILYWKMCQSEICCIFRTQNF